MGALASADLSRPAVKTTVRSGARSTWFYPFLCCAALVVCVLIANPFNSAGFCDDWSYARVAMKLAQTGRFQYNGWGSPILLFQTFWAVPWIRAFGFSFPVLDAAMMPISAGFVLLVYATGRAVGLSRELSAFASIATGTSPLFVPLAASFMTDVPGCFFCMLCVYAAIRSAQAEGSRSAARWLWLLTAAGVIGGANRQVVWIGPVALIPYLAWLRRHDRKFLRQCVAAYPSAGLVILAIVHYLSQPYGPLELTHAQLSYLLDKRLGDAIGIMVSLLLVCVLASLPAYCCLAKRKSFGWLLVYGAALGVGTFAVVILTGLSAPYGNNVLTWTGISTESQSWFRVKPASLSPLIRIALTAVVNACVVVSIVGLAGRFKRLRGTPNAAILSIFGLFTAGYMALILPGSILGFAFDRYMLPIFPLAILAILMQVGRSRRSAPPLAWVCLAVFAYYGIATTHDYIEAGRARIAAAQRLENRGIARDRISAGFEYDGWTELDRSGHANAVGYEDLVVDDAPKGFWFSFWDHTPDLRPDYVILNWTSPATGGNGESTFEYRTWLPPFRRSAVVWKRSDLTAAYQAVRLAAALRW